MNCATIMHTFCSIYYISTLFSLTLKLFIVSLPNLNTDSYKSNLNNVALYIIRCKFYYGTTKRENANGAKGTTAKHIRRKNGL